MIASRGNASATRRLKSGVMDFSRLQSRFSLAVTIVLACAALLDTAGGLSAQRVPQKKSQPRTKLDSSARTADAVVPFRTGEKLDYRILWSTFSVNAAKAQLSVAERRPFYGQQAWHFQAVAHTVDTMRMLFDLDDQFDSYTGTANLESLQFEMYLREQGKQQDSVFRMSKDGDPAPPRGPVVRVPPGTRDAIGFVYGLRAVDWQRTRDVQWPVFDGRKLYEASARLVSDSAEVSVPAGQYTASHIAVRIYERGRELSQTSFEVWLAQDAARTPVLIEFEVPFGTGRVELTHAG